MKIKNAQESDKVYFAPKEITLVFQSQDDLDKFGALLNHTGFIRALNLESRGGHDKSYQMLESLGADVNRYWKHGISDMIQGMDKDAEECN